MNNFVKNLPKLTIIAEIIAKKQFVDQDVLAIKLTLDIYKNHLQSDVKHYNELKTEFIPLAFLFYNSLTYEQLEKIYVKLISERCFYKKVAENKIVVFKRRDNYLEYYNLLKLDYMMIFEGISTTKFTV